MSPVTGLVLLLVCSYVSTSTAEYPTKDGICPENLDYPTACNNPNITYKNLCENDAQCDGEKKCCFSACIKQCKTPLGDKMDSCPYYNFTQCRVMRPLSSNCHKDAQCEGTHRCCCFGCRKQCVPTVKVKHGQCPAPKTTCYGTYNEAPCKVDSNCSGEKKCCDQCGMTCVTPEKEHDGVCPTSMEELSCMEFNNSLCSQDSDCPLEQKCCLSGDTLKCQPVTNEKRGSCPPPSTICPAKPTQEDKCTSDKCCTGPQKCCTPLCIRECTDPIAIRGEAAP